MLHAFFDAPSHHDTLSTRQALSSVGETSWELEDFFDHRTSAYNTAIKVSVKGSSMRMRIYLSESTYRIKTAEG